MSDKAPAADPVKAQKKDLGKPPVWRGVFNYFPRAIVAVAMVSEYGDRKYNPDNPVFGTGWREVPDGLNRYMDADARHMLKRAMAGEYDDESGMAHLAHKAWCAMAELERALSDGYVVVMRGNDVVDGKPVPGTATEVKL